MAFDRRPALELRKELERGRVLYDGTTYTLNRRAFPEDVIDALARALFDE